MAKEKKVKKKKSGKKTGKKKWFLIIPLLLAGLIYGGYFFGLDEKIKPYLPNPEITSKPAEYFSKSVDYVVALKDSLLSDKEGDSKKDDLSPSIIELEGEQISGEKTQGDFDYNSASGYYVKVEDCINITCQQEVIKFLKRERLPYKKKQTTRKTRYFELISSTVFTRIAAKAKIDLLRLEPNIKGDPYLVKVKNRYKISLGQFPREDTGARLKAELTHLYPRLKIEFELKPKAAFYRVNTFFVGPFKKSKATSVHKKLQENPEYETSKITLNI